MIKRKRAARGYTAVELMMALGLFGVGVSGIIAMQKVTVVSNQHAKNLAIATNIAEAWLDQLATDATLWTSPSSQNGSSDITSTSWVKQAASADEGKWVLPTYDANRKFGPGFDALGAPLPTAGMAKARFCAHVRLTSLYAADGAAVAGGRTTLPGNGLVRSEVRVFWQRDGQPPIADACTAVAGVTAMSADAAKDQYHMVYKVSAVRQRSSAK